jgi:transaldolase
MPVQDETGLASPLLAELQDSTGPVPRKLSVESARRTKIEKLELDEEKFRWLVNENAMATEKLAEGIRLFNADAVKQKDYIAQRL